MSSSVRLSVVRLENARRRTDCVVCCGWFFKTSVTTTYFAWPLFRCRGSAAPRASSVSFLTLLALLNWLPSPPGRVPFLSARTGNEERRQKNTAGQILFSYLFAFSLEVLFGRPLWGEDSVLKRDSYPNAGNSARRTLSAPAIGRCRSSGSEPHQHGPNQPSRTCLMWSDRPSRPGNSASRWMFKM